MKNKSIKRRPEPRLTRLGWLRHCGVGALLLAGGAAAQAADTNGVLTAQQIYEGGTNVYNNWVEFGVGGFMTHGNARSEEQRLNSSH